MKFIKSSFSAIDYTRDELETAFNLVCNVEDWKGPINKTVLLQSLSTALITEAVYFFTSTIPSFTVMLDGKFLVEADGYRHGPAGDH